jgi:DNA-binding NtrC family response regulator
VVEQQRRSSDFSNEREILYKVLFDMKSDLNDLKKLTLELLKNESSEKVQEENRQLIRKIYGDDEDIVDEESAVAVLPPSRGYSDLPVRPAQPAERVTPAPAQPEDRYHFAEEIEEEETLSLQEKEIELIRKALERNKGKRKAAAAELGISERTLYRKIKQYDL